MYFYLIFLLGIAFRVVIFWNCIFETEPFFEDEFDNRFLCVNLNMMGCKRGKIRCVNTRVDELYQQQNSENFGPICCSDFPNHAREVTTNAVENLLKNCKIRVF